MRIALIVTLIALVGCDGSAEREKAKESANEALKVAKDAYEEYRAKAKVAMQQAQAKLAEEAEKAKVSLAKWKATADENEALRTQLAVAQEANRKLQQENELIVAANAELKKRIERLEGR